jgi:flagellar hook-basal body complex protein FliE
MESGIRPLDWRFQPIEEIVELSSRAQQQKQAEEDGPSFVDMLRGQLDQVIDLQNEAEHLQQELAAGRIDDVNQVILAVQKADLALAFTLELRNKVIEAYQEISRMQL